MFCVAPLLRKRDNPILSGLVSLCIYDYLIIDVLVILKTFNTILNIIMDWKEILYFVEA